MLYPSPNKFDGNYTEHYRKATIPSFQGIINILLGKHEEGIALLTEFSDSETNYYKAFALWCLDKKEEATKLLDDKDSYHKKLKEFIGRKVRVLCQARNDGCPGWDITGTLKQDPEFEVMSIGNYPNDEIQMRSITPAKEILSKLNLAPDFYFAHMVEYKILPMDLEEFTFPVIFSSNDIQCQLSTILSSIYLCDAFITLGSQSFDSLKFSKTPVFTYPKMFGIVPEIVNNNLSNNKDLDAFFSGNLQAFGLYDRTSLLLKFFEGIKDHPFHFTEKKVSLGDYFNLLSRAKVVPSCIQQGQDSFSSRSLEAIAAGSIAMVPEGNATGIYFDRSCGLVEYTPCRIKETFLDIVNNWDNYYQKSATAGQSIALQKFNFKTIINNLFKFLSLVSIYVSENKTPNVPCPIRFARIVEPVITSAAPAYNDAFKSHAIDNINYLKSVDNYDSSLKLQTIVAHWQIRYDGTTAKETLEKILEKFPKDMTANFFYGRLIGSIDHCLKVINEEMEINKEFPPMIDFLEPYIVWNRHKIEIIKWLNGGSSDKVISMIKAISCINLHWLYKDSEKSIMFLRKALEFDPDNFYVMWSLAVRTDDKHLFPKALERFRYLKTMPEWSNLFCSLDEIIPENEKIRFIK